MPQLPDVLEANGYPFLWSPRPQRDPTRSDSGDDENLLAAELEKTRKQRAQSDTAPARAERTILIVRVSRRKRPLARLESCAPGAVSDCVRKQLETRRRAQTHSGWSDGPRHPWRRMVRQHRQPF